MTPCKGIWKIIFFYDLGSIFKICCSCTSLEESLYTETELKTPNWGCLLNSSQGPDVKSIGAKTLRANWQDNK